MARASYVTTHGSSGVVPNIPPIVELNYVYDKASNRLAVLDGRPRARQANRDHVATMDGLHRLTQYDRGVAVENSGVWSINTFAQGSQAWGYDHLGNWMTSKEDVTGDGDFLDTDENEPRTHNLANELLGRDIDDDATDEITITYDHVGNILLTDDGTTEYGYAHDAWNRLVKITIDGGSGATTLGEYEYNGLNHRIRTKVDTDFSGSVDEERIMIYDASWRLAEEQIDTDLDETAEEVRAHIWGERYIDDAIAMLKDTDVDGDYEDGGGSERSFFVTDAQFSVVAVLDDAANIEERISYDAYGRARHHDWRDVDGDGDYDTVDKGMIDYIVLNAFSPSGEPISSAAYYDPDADLDRNGIINGTDSTLGGTNWATALARGVLSSDAVDNATGYDGYRYNPETMQYTVRNRWYDPVLGRWLQRDPLRYVDGMGLYQFVSANPNRLVDPSGQGPKVIHNSTGPISVAEKRIFSWRDPIRDEPGRTWWPWQWSWHDQDSDYLIAVRTDYQVTIELAARRGRRPEDDDTGTLLSVRFSSIEYTYPRAKYIGPVVNNSNAPTPPLAGKVCKKYVYLKQPCLVCQVNYSPFKSRFTHSTEDRFVEVEMFGETALSFNNIQGTSMECNTSVAERQLNTAIRQLNANSHDMCKKGVSFDAESHLNTDGEVLTGTRGTTTPYIRGQNDGVTIFARYRYKAAN